MFHCKKILMCLNVPKKITNSRAYSQKSNISKVYLKYSCAFLGTILALFFSLANIVHANNPPTVTILPPIAYEVANQDILFQDFSIRYASPSNIVYSFRLTNKSLIVYPNLTLTTTLHTQSQPPLILQSTSTPLSLAKYEAHEYRLNFTPPKYMPNEALSLTVELKSNERNVIHSKTAQIPMDNFQPSTSPFVSIQFPGDFLQNTNTQEPSFILASTPKSGFSATLTIQGRNLLTPDASPFYTDHTQQIRFLTNVPIQRSEFNLPSLSTNNPIEFSFYLENENNERISNILRYQPPFEKNYATIQRISTQHESSTNKLNISVYLKGYSLSDVHSSKTPDEEYTLRTVVYNREDIAIFTNTVKKPFLDYLTRHQFSFDFPNTPSLRITSDIVYKNSTLHTYTLTSETSPIQEIPSYLKMQDLQKTVDLLDIDGTPYEEVVKTLVQKNVVNGYEDGTFLPQNPITRAEFITMFYRLFYNDRMKNTKPPKNYFVDVPSNHYAYFFINDGASLNLLSGYGDNTFKPNKAITYAEAFTVCVRILQSEDALKLLTQWPDDFIAKAEALGLTKNLSVANFNQNATRGDIAHILLSTFQQYE